MSGWSDAIRTSIFGFNGSIPQLSKRWVIEWQRELEKKFFSMTYEPLCDQGRVTVVQVDGMLTAQLRQSLQMLSRVSCKCGVIATSSGGFSRQLTSSVFVFCELRFSRIQEKSEKETGDQGDR